MHVTNLHCAQSRLQRGKPPHTTLDVDGERRALKVKPWHGGPVVYANPPRDKRRSRTVVHVPPTQRTAEMTRKCESTGTLLPLRSVEEAGGRFAQPRPRVSALPAMARAALTVAP